MSNVDVERMVDDMTANLEQYIEAMVMARLGMISKASYVLMHEDKPYSALDFIREGPARRFGVITDNTVTR